MTAALRAVASSAALLVVLAACAAPTPRAAPPSSPTADAAWNPAGAHAFAPGEIYFASTRPRAPGDARSDLDTWVARPTPTGFAPPQHLGAPIDSPALEVGPSVTRDGTLYFTSDRSGPPGIYRAARRGDGYADPERLPPIIRCAASSPPSTSPGRTSSMCPSHASPRCARRPSPTEAARARSQRSPRARPWARTAGHRRRGG